MTYCIKNDSIYIAFGGELFTLKKDWNKRKKLFTGLKCGKIESMITYNNKIFIGAHYGWLCESMGKIYSTSDYGITWDTVIKPFINVLSLAASKNIIVAGTQYNTC